MFEDWKFNRQLRKLQRERARIEKAYAGRMSQAFKNKVPTEEKENIIAGKRIDLDEADDEINLLTTGYLISQARKMFIDIPPMDSDTSWFESRAFGGRYLTPVGITKLRNDIRAEKKASWDVFQPKAALIVTLVTSLTGLSGAIIGVLSFLQRPSVP